MPPTLIFSIKISILPSDCEAHNILDRLRGSVSFACQFNLWLCDGSCQLVPGNVGCRSAAQRAGSGPASLQEPGHSSLELVGSTCSRLTTAVVWCGVAADGEGYRDTLGLSAVPFTPCGTFVYTVEFDPQLPGAESLLPS